MRAIYEHPNFSLDRDASGKLGVHSTKKYATTKARSSGVPRDFIDYRARWRNKRMQEIYADTVLPWPDIKTASKLCVGGICMYKLKDGCGLSNEWLSEHVAPAIQQCFGSGVAEILAKPLLWACLDEECASMVPEHIRVRILNALRNFTEQSSLAEGENCVEKVLVIASEVEGVVSLDEVPSEYTAAIAGRGAGRGAAGLDADWKNMVIAKMNGMARDIVDIKNTQASHHEHNNRQNRRMERNVNRIAQCAGTRVRNVGGSNTAAGGGGSVRRGKPANLCGCSVG